MFFEDCLTKEITEIRGSAQLPDEYEQALYADFALNCEYNLQQQVKTRRGFGQAFTPDSGSPHHFMTAMMYWVKANAKWLLYYIRAGGLNTAGTFVIRNLTNHVENFLGGDGTPAAADIATMEQFGNYAIA